MKLPEKFFQLFTGLDRAHGRFIIPTVTTVGAIKPGDKVKGSASTVLSGPTSALWEQHLEGKRGLGVIPIMADNTCLWGAIDVDIYDLDIIRLEEVCEKHLIPCVICRTKSGGAHLYFFTTVPIPAADMQHKLDEIAGILGFPGVEVFPKQTMLANDRDVGNWINMPYFDSRKTLRYAVRDGVALSAAEFVDYANKKKATPEALMSLKLESYEALSDGPPCLQHLCKTGFPSGSMNNALFSMGVYARQKFGDDWEGWVDKYNVDYMGPGSSKEVQNIIKMLKKNAYFYKCNDTPLKPYCDKGLCVRRKFGIGGDDATVPFVLGTLQKINSLPPIWFIDVDGGRIELTTDDLLDQGKFRKLCVEKIHKLPKRLKAPIWDDIVAEKLDNLEVIEVPDDTSITGQLLLMMSQFFARPPAEEKADMLMGRHYEEEGVYMFRSPDLLMFLERLHFRILPHKLWNTLRQAGATHGQFNIKGKCVQYWALPEANLQTEHFDLKDGTEVPF